MLTLVTGATGFLGSHVVEELLAKGHTVRALVRGSSDPAAVRLLEDLGAEIVVGGIGSAEEAAPACAGVEAVVHCAGVVKALDLPGYERVNRDGTRNLCEALAEAQNGGPRVQRLVLVSSIAAAGPVGGDGPVSNYGRSKLAGENVAREFAAREAPGRLPVTIIRPPAIYGPRDTALLGTFRGLRRGFVPVAGPADAQFSMVHVTDCARAIVAAAEAESAPDAVNVPVYTVDDGGVHGWVDLGERIARVAGAKRTRTLQLPRFLVRLAGALADFVAFLRRRPFIFSRDKVREMMERNWHFGHDAISRDLGWKPTVDIDEGLAQTAAWYRERELLK